MQTILNICTFVLSLIVVGLYICSNTTANDCHLLCGQIQDISGTCTFQEECKYATYPTLDDICCFNPSSGGRENCSYGWLNMAVKLHSGGSCLPLCCYLDGPNVCVGGEYQGLAGSDGYAVDDIAWGAFCL